ncbi:MAG: hypothetical protein KZQ65_09500 [Candidatus Thiodiazotropha sp. (ex Gloverina cf. vestifex)]|nr:hypothetical protein [Candidatus Thiodiazotropha sp. (ex Gloverina cf. vestifex)]
MKKNWLLILLIALSVFATSVNSDNSGSSFGSAVGKAWDGVKSGSKEAWDGVSEGSHEAWEATKEGSGEVWDATKEALNESFVSERFLSLASKLP